MNIAEQAQEPIDTFFLNRMKEAYEPYRTERVGLTGQIVDWSQGNNFSKELTKNATFSFIKGESGQVLKLAVKNTGFTPVTVSFPKDVVFSYSSLMPIKPNQSVSYVFINYKGTIFGEIE